MRVLKSKRGVSPLVATILLIAFAVALGAVVMQFGAGLESSGCGPDVQLHVESACVAGSGESGTVRVTVKNIGAVGVSKAQVWVHGDRDGIKTSTVEQSIDKLSSGMYEVQYDFNSYGKVKEVEVIPFADGILCEESRTKALKLRKC